MTYFKYYFRYSLKRKLKNGIYFSNNTLVLTIYKNIFRKF